MHQLIAAIDTQTVVCGLNFFINKSLRKGCGRYYSLWKLTLHKRGTVIRQYKIIGILPKFHGSNEIGIVQFGETANIFLSSTLELVFIQEISKISGRRDRKSVV